MESLTHLQPSTISALRELACANRLSAEWCACAATRTQDADVSRFLHELALERRDQAEDLEAHQRLSEQTPLRGTEIQPERPAHQPLELGRLLSEAAEDSGVLIRAYVAALREAAGSPLGEQLLRHYGRCQEARGRLRRLQERLLAHAPRG